MRSESFAKRISDCRWLFIRLAFLAIISTGILKLISAADPIKILQTASPLAGFLTNRQLLIAVGALEIYCACALFSKKLNPFSSAEMLIVWLSSLFILYRVYLWAVNYQGSCLCLGNAAAWLHLSKAAADTIMGVLACLLFGGASLLLIGRRLQNR